MNDSTVDLDQTDETLAYEVSDGALEAAAGTEPGMPTISIQTYGCCHRPHVVLF